MPKYRVYLIASAETYREVEAEDETEAEDKAFSEEMPTLCAHCSGWGSGPWMELSDSWEVNAVEEIGNSE